MNRSYLAELPKMDRLFLLLFLLFYLFTSLLANTITPNHDLLSVVL